MDRPPSARDPSPARPYQSHGQSHISPQHTQSHSPSPLPQQQAQLQNASLATFEGTLLDPQFTTDAFAQDYSQNASDFGFSQNSQFYNSSASNAAMHLSPDGSRSAASNDFQFADESGQVQFPDFDVTNEASFDPSLLYGAQAQQQQQQQQQQQVHRQSASLDPNSLALDQINAMQAHSPTPPHLLASNTVFSSRSTSPRHSPSPSQPQQQQYVQKPMRSRNTSESLDPSSAAYPHGYPPGMMGGDWAAGAAFRGHRRKPSDAISDISSHSNQASPFIGHMDSFDQNSHVSPLLGAQNDVPLFQDSLGLNRFTLSDSNSVNNDHLSVSSIQNSPRLPIDQQPLPAFTSTDNFGLSPDITLQNNDTSFNAFQGMQQFDPNNFNSIDTHHDTLSPPEINIDFAPPSRQPSFGPRSRAASANALTPPDAMRRKRAKSDPHAGLRSPSPGIQARGRSPSLQPASLSPATVPMPPSRSPSPAGRNRSASSASDSRQYLLDLADPERSTAGSGADQKRQKHPATFQCTLCPKRFTRAYNLRSHLRTHTDERPFVCTVCGKAFARQHDRKRHEGLHSGEKKFVCKGALKTGASWGCGRRFARADALGRHFRSEAGRECIKPLLDEEAEERRTAWLEEQRQHQMQSQQGFVAPGPMTDMPQPGPQLPAVLLQMYPDLAGFNFGASTGPIPEDLVDMEDDYGGRSSFDASSGNEFEMSDNDIAAYEQMQMDANSQNWP